VKVSVDVGGKRTVGWIYAGKYLERMDAAAPSDADDNQVSVPPPGQPQEVSSLRQSLRDTEDLGKRREAATKLKEMGQAAADAAGDLVKALATTTTVEFPLPTLGDPGRKLVGARPAMLGVCCEALLSIGGSAREAIVHGLGQGDAWTRYGCAWVAGRLGDKSLVPLLEKIAAGEGDDKVKKEISLSLALLGAHELALRVSAGITDLDVRRACLCSLLPLLIAVDKDLARRTCLELGRDTQHAKLRVVAAQAAGMLDDRESLQMLIRLSGRPSGVPGACVDWEACRSLGIRRAAEAKAALAARALDESTNDGTEVQAAWALARLGDDRGVAVLRRMAASSSFAKGQAEAALANIEKGEALTGSLSPPNPEKFERRFEGIGNGLFVAIE
jgi:HEAT repeat protein